MADFKKKTYDNSYLFMTEADKHHRAITNYIIKAERIEKEHDAFKGIIEEVRKQQRSSILYTLLHSNKVVLCMHNQEMPRAFKVFAAKDLRFEGDVKIFIDVTNLITYKNDYF